MVLCSWAAGCPTGKLSVWGWTSVSIPWASQAGVLNKDSTIARNGGHQITTVAVTWIFVTFKLLTAHQVSGLKISGAWPREREKGLETFGNKRDWTWTRSVFTKSWRGHLNKEIPVLFLVHRSSKWKLYFLWKGQHRLWILFHWEVRSKTPIDFKEC